MDSYGLKKKHQARNDTECQSCFILYIISNIKINALWLNMLYRFKVF